MTNVTFAVPEEVFKKMREHPEIKWSEIARKAITDYASSLEYKDKHKGSQLLFVSDEKGKLNGKFVQRWDAHSAPGVKHLAFAILVLNSKGEFVLHKRPGRKVGGGKLDTPVSHVLANETKNEAMWRCLKDEYGIEEHVPFVHFDGFSYYKDYGDGTCENEFCLVSIARYDGKIKPNEKEVEGKLVYLPARKALQEIKKNPDKYPVWFIKSIELLSKDSTGRTYLA